MEIKVKRVREGKGKGLESGIKLEWMIVLVCGKKRRKREEEADGHVESADLTQKENFPFMHPQGFSAAMQAQDKPRSWEIFTKERQAQYEMFVLRYWLSVFNFFPTCERSGGIENNAAVMHIFWLLSPLMNVL